MFYARTICKRVNPAQFGDDPGVGVFENTQPLPTTHNDPIAYSEDPETLKAEQLVYAHDHPFSSWWSPSNPLGLPPGQGPQDGATSPWIKWAMVIGGVAVGGYALKQVASVGSVIRGR